MDIRRRNNVQCFGNGEATLVFAHGFGCDQSMWRFLTPHLEARYKIVLVDLTGCGDSDVDAYDEEKYGTLHGYATDLLDIVNQCCNGPVVLVGHAVGAMIGMLATIKLPSRFAGQVMLSPTPFHLNDDTYIGGVNPEDGEQLLAMLLRRYAQWTQRPALPAELQPRLRRNDEALMRYFARVAFLSDLRGDVAKSVVPALILHCSDDLLAPQEVGEYLLAHLPHSMLVHLDAEGHCPHLSAPSASVRAIDSCLDNLQ